MGGDDYITKPFNSLEVVARIKAQLARRRLYQQEAPSACYTFADFEISKDTGGLTVRGQQLHCTAKEFALLLFLPSIRAGCSQRPSSMNRSGVKCSWAMRKRLLFIFPKSETK